MFRVKLEEPTSENSHLVDLGEGKFAIVDIDVDPVIWKYKWRAIKWHKKLYAVASGIRQCSTVLVAMHRLIAETPSGEVCHHANRNSLDNRVLNLMNMTNRHHAELHKIRRWTHAKNKRTTEAR